MSRLAKRPILVPAGVSVSSARGTLTMKGPKGELTRSFMSEITFTISGQEISLAPTVENNHTRALLGTYAAHVRNMIRGVTEGFVKQLEIEGVGYRAEVKGNSVHLMAGFSHPVLLPIPEGISVVVEKNMMTISGIDKDVVGEFAAVVRRVKPPEPYKGKGIHYVGEYILRKQGKRAVA